jgi:hypothetical protein
MHLNEQDRKALATFGWVVECESPFEIAKMDGSFARDEAAQIVLADCKRNCAGPVKVTFEITLDEAYSAEEAAYAAWEILTSEENDAATAAVTFPNGEEREVVIATC